MYVFEYMELKIELSYDAKRRVLKPRGHGLLWYYTSNCLAFNVEQRQIVQLGRVNVTGQNDTW